MPSGIYIGEAPTQSEHRMIDQAFETTVKVRTAVLSEMTPNDIAGMIVSHFDDSIEDAGDVLAALALELKQRDRQLFYTKINDTYTS